MFEQTFKNIDDVLRKDAGCTSELDYTEPVKPAKIKVKLADGKPDQIRTLFIGSQRHLYAANPGRSP